MREQQPNFKDKIVPICGELVEPHMGISDEDYKLLGEKLKILLA